MSCCVTKNYYLPQKKRILLLNTAEIRRKTHLRQPYCNLYAYGANNPVRYIDPDGEKIINTDVWYAKDFMQMFDATWPDSQDTIARTGCTLIASNRAANVAINLFGCDKVKTMEIN